MSPVMYNDSAGSFEIFDPTCCEQPMVDTGCDAPGCRGFACEECGAGCDIEMGEVGLCWTALLAESAEARAARHDRERVAFGLPSAGADRG